MEHVGNAEIDRLKTSATFVDAPQLFVLARTELSGSAKDLYSYFGVLIISVVFASMASGECVRVQRSQTGSNPPLDATFCDKSGTSTVIDEFVLGGQTDITYTFIRGSTSLSYTINFHYVS